MLPVTTVAKKEAQKDTKQKHQGDTKGTDTIQQHSAKLVHALQFKQPLAALVLT